MDVAVHHNRRDAVIKEVRDWLNTDHAAEHPLPGAGALIQDHQKFLSLAPSIISKLRLDSPEELTHIDYLHVVEQAVAELEVRRQTLGARRR